MKRSKRVIVSLALICVLGGVLFAIPSPGPLQREIYVTEGGSNFLVMNRDALGNYSVSDASTTSSVGNYTTTVSGTEKNLTITYHMPYESSRVMSCSRAGSGSDWWITKTENRFPRMQSRVSSVSPPSQIRFLHRLDDENVVRYFNAIPLAQRQNSWISTQSTAPLVQMASAIVAAHPADLYARILLLDAAARCDPTLLKDKLKEWGSDFESTDDPLLLSSYRKAQRTNEAYELAKNGDNGYALLDTYLDASMPLEARLKAMCKALQMPRAAMATDITQSLNSVPNFLEKQVMIKVSRVVATLMLFQGRRNEARDSLASDYRIGQWLCGEYSNIAQLIGIALRTIASAGLSLYALNACETHEEFAALWSLLENLNSVDQARQSRDPASFEQNTWKLFGAFDLLQEVEVRGQVGDAKFQLVRMATAAKDHFISTGKWPASEREFTPLLPDGPPKDVFSSGSLRSFATADAFYCYSVGPDAGDDAVRIEYDPTNGTISAGDIITTITRERQYPFPREAVRASSPEDIKKQFPNGLPADPFADTKGRGFSITYSSPVIIYSYGADTDQRTILPQEAIYRPTVQYDPTNGVTSAGDIFITLPGK